jgi:hypothetical protein
MSGVAGGGQPAGWFPDPTERHEHRYWDGVSWGDQVSDQGLTATDPLDGPQSPIAGTMATAPIATRAQRQAVQQRAPRKKWPWVLGGILTLFVVAGVGCAALLTTAVTTAVNQLNAEQRAHSISAAQFAGVPLGTSQPQVISSLGKQPENTQEFLSKGVLPQSNISSSCIYYNKTGGKFGDIYQFCFTNGALDTKNSY